jgi:hypothetical protein
MLQHRLTRFGIVGIVATLVHATTLIILKTLFQLGTGPANLLGFVVSFPTASATAGDGGEQQPSADQQAAQCLQMGTAGSMQ